MQETSYLTIPADFQEVANRCVATISPGCSTADVSILKQLTGGKSGALVLLVDIVAKSGFSGQCILKLDRVNDWEPPESQEPELHRVLAESDFGIRRIPRLLQAAKVDPRVAMVYEVAGGSLTSLRTADSLDSKSLRETMSVLSEELISELNADYVTRQRSSPSELLKEWLGYRLDPVEGVSLHGFVTSITEGSPQFQAEGELFPDPLTFARSELPADGSSKISFFGWSHGDAHLRNVLVASTDPIQYWLIDLALSRRTPLFYDHGYLEMALILEFLSEPSVARLKSVLRAADQPGDGIDDLNGVLPNDVALVVAMRAIREQLDRWQKRKEPNRLDSYRGQLRLARVAAGLNWTNKPLANEERLLSFVYSAWAARSYSESFAPSVWPPSTLSAPSVKVGPQKGGDFDRPSAWKDIWEAADRFDHESAVFVLVATPLSQGPESLCLGLLPWSLIIDLDENSDATGLYSNVGKILSTRRAVHHAGEPQTSVAYGRASAWLMADGWQSHGEAATDSLAGWRRTRLSRLRAALSDLARQTAPENVTVLILEEGSNYQQHLRNILEACDESFGERGHYVHVGEQGMDVPDLEVASFETPISTLLKGLRTVYGHPVNTSGPELVGVDGPVPVEVTELRHLEEDLTILHSQILDAQKREPAEDEFWRGNPPTWLDLHANLDVRRAVADELDRTLSTALASSRNLTVQLLHAPGAGGTTAALRAAWDLRLIHPVAVLAKYSESTVDRLDRLFHLAGRPVLLVADSSILTDVNREKLYHGVADRNARMVILHVIRTFKPEETDRHPLVVSDPLTPKETGDFLAAYLPIARNEYRRRKLREIARDTSPLVYRSPFFFGLITFEDDFEGIREYVEAHLAGVSSRARELIAHIALVTRFTQVGIAEGLLRLWLDVSSTRRVPLATLFGTGPSRLLINHHGRVRVMHAVLATEVLRQTLAPNSSDPEAWRLNLVSASLRFLEDVSEKLDEADEEALTLFTHLFIKREHWASGLRSGGPNFSELLLACPTADGQQRLLARLTEVCPHEPHFWNHRARHQIYQLREDYALAEGYVTTAIDLSPADSLHHHALGMVRRFWAQARLREATKERRASGGTVELAESLLSSVSELYAGAAQEFELARELSPEDSFGYITHVQLVLDVCRGLIDVSGQKDVVSATRSSGVLGAWIPEQLSIAESLLGRVRDLSGRSPESRYETRCRTGLTGLYGNLDQAIGAWESELSSTAQPEVLRRALVGAYRARRDRRWDRMSEAEIRRIAELTDLNLRSDPTNERDLRTWFAAYRRLPEFDHAEALDVLGAWAGRTDSVDAEYYRFILHFIGWLTNRERTEELTLEALDRLRCLQRPRKSWSFEWLSNSPEWCPVIHHSELGNWSKEIDFYEEVKQLRRVNGTIETIKGPQAGSITIGGKLRCFFTPRKEFWKPMHLNAKVNFFLGFSYDGLRAWSVSHGFVQDTPHDDSGADLPDELKEDAGVPAAGGVEPTHEAIRAFIRSEAHRSAELGQELLLTNVSYGLAARYGPKPHKQMGYETLSDLLRALGDFKLSGPPHRRVVSEK